MPLRTIDQYTKRVRGRWHEHAVADSRDARERSLDRLSDLRVKLVEARAWTSVVSLERLITDLEGVRGGPAESHENRKSGAKMATPALSADSMHERVPLLVQACARVAIVSGDQALIEQTRDALFRSLALLGAEPA
jgi:hypothetical protein